MQFVEPRCFSSDPWSPYAKSPAIARLLYGEFRARCLGVLFWGRKHPNKLWLVCPLRASRCRARIKLLCNLSNHGVSHPTSGRHMQKAPLLRGFCIWCPEAESNHRHEDFQSSALPTELSGQIFLSWAFGSASATRRVLNLYLGFESSPKQGQICSVLVWAWWDVAFGFVVVLIGKEFVHFL